jgi:hypothetical protein
MPLNSARKLPQVSGLDVYLSKSGDYTHRVLCAS